MMVKEELLLNREEIIQVLHILKTAYPQYNIEISRQVAENTIALWKSVFGEEDRLIVEFAVRQLSTTCVYPPTIAKILETLEKIKRGDGIDSGSAWKQVREAMHHFGYMREKEALSSMHPITAQVVGCMGWKDLCKSENSIVDRDHFCKLFDRKRGNS